MKNVCKLFKIALLSLSLGLFHSPAQAALILGQLIDENPPIRGLAYLDGVLIQDIVLAEETFADRFTGFVILDPFARPLDYFNVSYNIYAPDSGALVGLLSMSGGPDWPLVHTAYYSTFPGATLQPIDSPTGNLIADGNFHTVLEFALDNGDQYIFQYKNIPAQIPEPGTVFIFGAGLLGMMALRRRSPHRLLD